MNTYLYYTSNAAGELRGDLRGQGVELLLHRVLLAHLLGEVYIGI